MRGSVLLAAVALPLGGCSVLLDWADYTGGLPDAAAVELSDGGGAEMDAFVTEAGPMDAGPPADVFSTMGPHDAQSLQPETGAELESGSVEAEASTCDLSLCPTACNITVEYHVC